MESITKIRLLIFFQRERERKTLVVKNSIFLRRDSERRDLPLKERKTLFRTNCFERDKRMEDNCK